MTWLHVKIGEDGVRSEKSVTFFGVEGNKALSSFQYEYL